MLTKEQITEEFFRLAGANALGCTIHYREGDFLSHDERACAWAVILDIFHHGNRTSIHLEEVDLRYSLELFSKINLSPAIEELMKQAVPIDPPVPTPQDLEFTPLAPEPWFEYCLEDDKTLRVRTICTSVIKTGALNPDGTPEYKFEFATFARVLPLPQEPQS